MLELGKKITCSAIGSMLIAGPVTNVAFADSITQGQSGYHLNYKHLKPLQGPLLINQSGDDGSSVTDSVYGSVYGSTDQRVKILIKKTGNTIRGRF